MISSEKLLSNDQELDRLACALESTGDYRVLRRIKCAPFSNPTQLPTRRAIFVDVETTGLDRRTDVVIELGILPFDYTLDGTIVSTGEAVESLNDPGFPIPAEVSRLTGITDDMVKGAVIKSADVIALVEKAALIISHNAAFDRPFCERHWPVFSQKPWACSLIEIDWKSEGFDGKKLGQIAASYGMFFEAHRAIDDCRAGVDILSRCLPVSKRTGLGALLESARKPRWRIWAEGAPFSHREILKGRGYRWTPDTQDRAKSWSIEVPESELEAELSFLTTHIYEGRVDNIPRKRFTALDRYTLAVG